MIKNSYEIQGETTVIFIKNKKDQCFQILIDTVDFEKINKSTWRARVKSHTVYSSAKIKGRTIDLHRLLLDFPEGCIDHINHNGLDNRRSNLRIVSLSQNQQNQDPSKVRSSSGFRNVIWSKRSQKWLVVLSVSDKPVYIGTYNDVQIANQAAIDARKKIYGIAQ